MASLPATATPGRGVTAFLPPLPPLAARRCACLSRRASTATTPHRPSLPAWRPSQASLPPPPSSPPPPPPPSPSAADAASASRTSPSPSPPPAAGASPVVLSPEAAAAAVAVIAAAAATRVDGAAAAAAAAAGTPPPPSPLLTSAEKSALRSLAGTRERAKLLVDVRMAGTTPSAAFMTVLTQSLGAHELVKVRTGVSKKAAAKALGQGLAAAVGGQVVQVMGHTVLLWRAKGKERGRGIDLAKLVAGRTR